MDRLQVAFDQSIPQFKCSECVRCTSVFGTSLCKTKGRGCCFYFPEFGLYDLHRMAVSLEGLQLLDVIRHKPGVVINPYSIYVKGSFDREGYEEYLKGGELINEDSINDQTLFFRVCPFVRSEHGCTLSPKHRTLVCNFFVCSEILGRAEIRDELVPYLEERSRYARWEHRENTELQHMLLENDVNLVTDFKASIEVLQNLSLNIYEFPALEPVDYLSDEFSRGA